MKLVDTSVWVDFFRGRARADRPSEHLDANEVLLHPWVLGDTRGFSGSWACAGGRDASDRERVID